MRLYLAIYRDDDYPDDGILLTEYKHQHSIVALAVIWRTANYIAWFLQRMGLRIDNAQEWSA